MRDFLYHLFLPHEGNNFRAKLLHHKIILFCTLVLFFGGLLLSLIRTNYPSVLGISFDISANELLRLTNKNRTENNLPSLSLNQKLSLAARKKAENMFAQNYWAHNSPDGKTPWVFIKDAGYSYTYAGENLARGFDTTEEVVSAWMASPKHRANVLSENFREVGFAVTTGKLNGEETVLVVEEFGDQDVGYIAEKYQNKEEGVLYSGGHNAISSVFSESSGPKSFIKSLSLTNSLDKIILSVFILALVLDMIVVERKRVARFVGHNMDHVFFLGLILLIIGLLSKGVII